MNSQKFCGTNNIVKRLANMLGISLTVASCLIVIIIIIIFMLSYYIYTIYYIYYIILILLLYHNNY